jgi:hypothetical protein
MKMNDTHGILDENIDLIKEYRDTCFLKKKNDVAKHQHNSLPLQSSRDFYTITL